MLKFFRQLFCRHIWLLEGDRMICEKCNKTIIPDKISIINLRS